MGSTSPRSRAWLMYCLLAILLWGVWGIVSKAAEAQQVQPAAIQVISTLGVVPVALLFLASPNLKKGTRHLAGGIAAFSVGLCGGLGNLAMLESFDAGGEASTVLPLTGMFPLVTILLAVFVLRERINVAQWFGIAVALAALYLFNRPVPNAEQAAAEVVSGEATLITPWMLYALIALVLWGVAGVLQKVATNRISTELSTILFALAFIPVAGGVAITMPIDWNISSKGWAYSLLFGAMIGIGTLVLFAAYRGGKASIVTAIYALYPAVTVVLAVPIFSEKIDARKGAAIVLALAAGVALSWEKPAAQPAIARVESP